jgi:coenzyme F420-dependent glucose-6-phosphate dehydrogenase
MRCGINMLGLKFQYNLLLEMYSPLDVLLQNGIMAEKNGFDAIAASDHFHPFMHTNANCGFAWVFLTTMAEKTSKVEVGPMVTAPILRYHPGIVAQAFATLEQLYPKRVFLGIGSGEALNEVPLGYDWPAPSERVERMEEAVRIIRLLWENDFVAFRGKYYKLNKANLYTKPKNKIPIFVAAGGTKTAKIAGRYGDGIIVSSTVLKNKEQAGKILRSFAEEAKSAGKDPENMVKIVGMTTSYDEDRQRAVNGIKYWASTMLRFVFSYSISDPREIESYAKLVSDEQIASNRLVFTTAEDYISIIEEFKKQGFNRINIEDSSPDRQKFIKMFGREVIPYFKK